MDIFFSIIIPLYNKDKFIERTLKSIDNQTYKNYEIIIIDDKSIDNSYEKVINLKNKIGLNQLYTYQNEVNKGVVYSRNRGISLATGDYFIFLDADDEFYSKDFLKEINNFIMKYDTEYIVTMRNYYGRYSKPNFNKVKKTILPLTKDFYEIISKEKFAFKGNFPYGGSASAILSRSSILDNFFDEEEEAYEDWLYFMKIYFNHKVHFYAQPSIKVNYDIDSLSHNLNNLHKGELKIPKVYYYLNDKEGLSALRKKFFWIWLTGYLRRNKDKILIKKLVKKLKKEILINLTVNKFSIYSLVNIFYYLIKPNKKEFK